MTFAERVLEVGPDSRVRGPHSISSVGPLIGSSRRDPTLDGIRGVAIMLVVLYHAFFFFSAFPVGGTASRLAAVARLFWCGVDLFFVLSGFLIGGILLEAKRSPRYFRTFYIRRAFRILPLYAVVLLVTALLGHSLPPFGVPLPAASYATLTQNIFTALTGSFGIAWLGVTWSLAIEEQFYLLAPLVVRLTTRRILLGIAAICVVVAPFVRLVLFRDAENGWIAAHVLMPTRVDALLLGVAAAVIVRNRRALEVLTRYRVGLVVSAAALTIIVAVFTLNNWTLGTIQLAAVGYTTLALLFGILLLLAVTDNSGMLSHMLQFKPLRALGVRAYGLYLFHVPSLYLTFLVVRHRAPRVASFSDIVTSTTSIALTIIAASLSWTYFEQPLLRIGHRARY